MSLQDTSQSPCETAHQPAGTRSTEHQVGLSFTGLLCCVIYLFHFKKNTTTPSRSPSLHVCRVQCANTRHLTVLHPESGVCVCVSSGGLKLVYKVSIRLKVDFPWYSADVHGAQAFLGCCLAAAPLPPQSAERVLYSSDSYSAAAEACSCPSEQLDLLWHS